MYISGKMNVANKRVSFLDMAQEEVKALEGTYEQSDAKLSGLVDFRDFGFIYDVSVYWDLAFVFMGLERLLAN